MNGLQNMVEPVKVSTKEVRQMTLVHECCVGARKGVQWLLTLKGKSPRFDGSFL